MKIYLLCFWMILTLVSQMQPAYAIPPPDFLFNIGAQVAQIFSILVLFFSAILAATKDFLGVIFARFKHKNLIWIALGLVILGVSLGGAYIYSSYTQGKAIQEWKETNQQEITQEIKREVMIKEDESVVDMPEPDAILRRNVHDKPEQKIVVEQNVRMPINPEISIKNEDFGKLLENESGIFILDAREDEEYGIGRMPGSTHIRFADLLDGAWKNLPADQEIYVLCWSGIRGKELTDFLRSQGVNARYLEEGVDGWVAFGGKWDGEIKFSKVYKAAQYNKMLSKAEFEKEVAGGAFVVDSRVKENYEKAHVEGSINLALIYTPSKDIEKSLDSVPAGRSVVTICDGWVSCFDAKIIGIKLEKKGHTFIGRYNNAL